MAARTVSITEFRFGRRPQARGKPDLFTLNYLRRGLAQPGGKLPLFDLDGQEVDPAIVRRCIADGLAEPWFSNPIMPDWLVCKLTSQGKALIESELRACGQPF